MMISFIAKTWPAWWVFAILVILRWFHVLRLSGPMEPDLDHEEAEKKSAVAAEIFPPAGCQSPPSNVEIAGQFSA